MEPQRIYGSAINPKHSQLPLCLSEYGREFALEFFTLQTTDKDDSLRIKITDVLFNYYPFTGSPSVITDILSRPLASYLAPGGSLCLMMAAMVPPVTQ